MKSEIEEDHTPQESDLWNDGIICAFEFIRGISKHVDSKQQDKGHLKQKPRHAPAHNPFVTSSPVDVSSLDSEEAHVLPTGHVEGCERNRWVPIGWTRISELVQLVPVNEEWANLDFMDQHDVPVTNLAPPYWERPEGPTWWCHMSAGHSFVQGWLKNATWLHPAIRLALSDKRKLFSELTKNLPYEVPVRVAGGLMFELLAHSFYDPAITNDSEPVIFRSWQAKNFLVSVMHIKENASNTNVPGILALKEVLYLGGDNVPKTIHEVIAHLACCLSRWDYWFYNKYVFAAVEDFELKFRSSRLWGMNILKFIFDRDISKVTRQLIRVKWSLEAREDIFSELLQNLRGSIAQQLLEGVIMRTKEMLGKEEVVHKRLFTIEDIMQNKHNALLQEKCMKITHNLTLLGGCGLLLTLLIRLFGINLDSMLGVRNMPYAFTLFSGIIVLLATIMMCEILGFQIGKRRRRRKEEIKKRKDGERSGPDVDQRLF